MVSATFTACAAAIELAERVRGPSVRAVGLFIYSAGRTGGAAPQGQACGPSPPAFRDALRKPSRSPRIEDTSWDLRGRIAPFATDRSGALVCKPAASGVILPIAPHRKVARGRRSAGSGAADSDEGFRAQSAGYARRNRAACRPKPCAQKSHLEPLDDSFCDGLPAHLTSGC